MHVFDATASVSASGPSSKSVTLNPYQAGGGLLISALTAGTYTMSASANLNNSDDVFTFPVTSFLPSRTVSVGSGQSQVDIAADQAYVNGALHLSALSNPPDITSGLAFARPGGTATSGGQSRDTMTAATDAHDIVASAGPWRIDLLQNVRLQRATPFLDETISTFQDARISRLLTLAAGDTQTMDFDWPVGEVTVRVSLSNGGTLSSPRLTGSCTFRDVSSVTQSRTPVLVTGRSSDDTGAASVTANGIAATPTSTSNPADPAEVAFQATVTLPQKGPNVVTTTAKDVSPPQKSTSDIRTVYWDDGPPTLGLRRSTASSRRAHRFRSRAPQTTMPVFRSFV